MRKEALWKIYDTDYAQAYNERYLLNPFSQTSAETELSVLKSVIDKDTKWLDLGCGTGYFLSCFPGTARAGLDMSPEMLKVAGQASPDALFFQEGDFRVDVPAWKGAWSLITCMWGAYCYLESVKEVEQLVSNIIRWIGSGGSLFLPVIDLEDLRPKMTVPYMMKDTVYGGPIALTSVTWSWKEDLNGKLHEHLVSPHIDHFIALLRPHFDQIEVVRYPPYMNGWVSRKAILATGRHDTGKEAAVTWRPVPPPSVREPREGLRIFRESMSPISSKQMVRELFYRLVTGDLFRALNRKIWRR